MAAQQRPRLSAAYETLAKYGLDARGIDSTEELLQAFQPVREEYKNQPDGRGEIYEQEIRPALLVIRSHLEQVHPRAFGEQLSKVREKPS